MGHPRDSRRFRDVPPLQFPINGSSAGSLVVSAPATRFGIIAAQPFPREGSGDRPGWADKWKSHGGLVCHPRDSPCFRDVPPLLFPINGASAGSRLVSAPATWLGITYVVCTHTCIWTYVLVLLCAKVDDILLHPCENWRSAEGPAPPWWPASCMPGTPCEHHIVPVPFTVSVSSLIASAGPSRKRLSQRPGDPPNFRFTCSGSSKKPSKVALDSIEPRSKITKRWRLLCSPPA